MKKVYSTGNPIFGLGEKGKEWDVSDETAVNLIRKGAVTEEQQKPEVKAKK